MKQSTPSLAAEPVPVRDGAQISVQDALDRGVATGLQGPLKVTVPAEPGAPFTVAEIARDWPVQRDEVALDPYTGAVTETILWQDFPVLSKLTRIGILAHMGDLFGLFSQLALAATALGLLCMIFWGYRMWWQRRPTRGDARRLTAPVRRGTLRALPQPTTFAIVLIAVVVGWLLPVLGVSLVLFVVGDAIAGEISRRPRADEGRAEGAVSPACRRSGTGCPPGSRNDSRARSRRSASGRRLRSVRSCPPLLPAGPRHVVRPRGGGLYSPWTRWAPNSRRRSTTASAFAQPENDPLAFGLITGSSGVSGGRSAPLPGRRADNPLRLTTRLRGALLPSTIIRWRHPRVVAPAGPCWSIVQRRRRRRRTW